MRNRPDPNDPVITWVVVAVMAIVIPGALATLFIQLAPAAGVLGLLLGIRWLIRKGA